MSNTKASSTKSGSEHGEPRKFIPYHYSIPEGEWSAEMFFRELETENPNLLNIPYYASIRKTLREKADPSERLPRIPIAQIMGYEPHNKTVKVMTVDRSGEFTSVTSMEMRLIPNSRAIYTFIEKKENYNVKWKIGDPLNNVGVSFYRYISEKAPAFKQESTKISVVYYETWRGPDGSIHGAMKTIRNSNHFILRLNPLIIAWYQDPESSEYYVSNISDGTSEKIESSGALLPLRVPPPSAFRLPTFRYIIDFITYKPGVGLRGFVYGPDDSIYLRGITRERKLKEAFMRVKNWRQCSQEQLAKLSEEFKLDKKVLYDYLVEKSNGWLDIEPFPKTPIIMDIVKATTPFIDIMGNSRRRLFGSRKQTAIPMPEDYRFFFNTQPPFSKKSMRIFYRAYKKSEKEKKKAKGGD